MSVGLLPLQYPPFLGAVRAETNAGEDLVCTLAPHRRFNVGGGLE